MSRMPDKAFILAAGKGTRLRPYTDTIPKPMVEIAGSSIIKRIIEKLAVEDVTEIIVNTHHLADVMEAHLAEVKTPRITISRETELLESGGAVKKALLHFGDTPFFIINGDALWDEEENTTALKKLAKAWDGSKMDILLLLQPIDKHHLTDFVGDYHLASDGMATRSHDKNGQYMFAGIRIAHPRIFEESPDGAFSFLELMDKAESKNRLYAVPHDGNWYHISTPEDLESVNEMFRNRG